MKHINHLAQLLTAVLSCSCGDDGRIRGWRWNEFSSSNYSVSSQGDIACFGMINFWEIIIFFFQKLSQEAGKNKQLFPQNKLSQTHVTVQIEF